jgi:hypothetical protein
MDATDSGSCSSRSSTLMPSSVTQTLRRLIRDAQAQGTSLHQIANRTGLDCSQLSRFVDENPKNHRGLKLDSIGALCAFFKLIVVPTCHYVFHEKLKVLFHFLGFDLRLMSAVNGVSRIPPEGKNLIVVAAVDHVLHFRIFDGDGKMVVDTNEKQLMEQVRAIEDLRNQLESLWPPHELTGSEKARVITAVTSIVGHILNKSVLCDASPGSSIRIRDLYIALLSALRTWNEGNSLRAIAEVTHVPLTCLSDFLKPDSTYSLNLKATEAVFCYFKICLVEAGEALWMISKAIVIALRRLWLRGRIPIAWRPPLKAARPIGRPVPGRLLAVRTPHCQSRTLSIPNIVDINWSFA